MTSDAPIRPTTNPQAQVLDLGVERAWLDYEQVWQQQREIHADVVAGRRPDTIMLLEHSSIFTAGTRTQHGDLPVDGSKVVDVDRGGRITWHGPGQLVVYPIVRLAEPMNVVGFVRELESVIMAALADLGLVTERVEGRSGVWVQGTRKVAAIGVRVAKGVTMHGLAVNADCDLSVYQRIVPCGIADAGVTSVSAELSRHVGTRTVADALLPGLIGLSDRRLGR